MQETARRILEYLAENPDANDTAEGIAQWWLLEREIRDRRAEVESSLSELVAAGLLVASRGAGAGTRFRLNPERTDEVLGLIDGGRG
jgi:DNA-binding IscR family transcriptional regulator